MRRFTLLDEPYYDAGQTLDVGRVRELVADRADAIALLDEVTRRREGEP